MFREMTYTEFMTQTSTPAVVGRPKRQPAYRIDHPALGPLTIPWSHLPRVQGHQPRLLCLMKHLATRQLLALSASESRQAIQKASSHLAETRLLNQEVRAIRPRNLLQALRDRRHLYELRAQERQLKSALEFLVSGTSTAIEGPASIVILPHAESLSLSGPYPLLIDTDRGFCGFLAEAVDPGEVCWSNARGYVTADGSPLPVWQFSEDPWALLAAASHQPGL